MNLKMLSIMLISMGAIIMLLSIVKYHATIRLVQGFMKKKGGHRATWYKVHHLLMMFFFIGYVVVIASIVEDVPITGDLFTSLIFFFGAAFVLIGILLQISMLKSIKKQQRKLTHKNTQVSQAEDATIFALAYLAEMRDFETGKHIERTSHYVRIVAEELSSMPEYKEHLTRRYIKDIVKAAPLHDIGKVGVADEVLKKPGKLTNEEFEQIKEHPAYGADILERAEKKLNFQSYLRIAIQLVRHHHERWDGKGYPDGLKGDEIPLSAQMMALADVYDALRSERCYKKEFSHQKSCEIIEQEMGKQFSPDIIKAFIQVKPEFENVSILFKDEH